MRNLECCICGGEAGRFEQHWNRDTGYGVCVECVAWLRSRGEPEPEIQQLYGVEGVNFAQAEVGVMSTTTVGYTPGPWAWEPQTWADIPRDSDMLAVLSGPSGRVCDFGHGAQFDQVAGSPPSVADARLIAAAPTLLEALRAVHAWWESGNFSRQGPLWDQLRAAIAQAEGR